MTFQRNKFTQLKLCLISSSLLWCVAFSFGFTRQHQYLFVDQVAYFSGIYRRGFVSVRAKNGDEDQQQGKGYSKKYDLGIGKHKPVIHAANNTTSSNLSSSKKRQLSVNKEDETSEILSKALWDKEHYVREPVSFATIHDDELSSESSSGNTKRKRIQVNGSSISVSQSEDPVWDIMRMEARMEAEREPLLVSFLFSTILNHDSLESALAFHLANRLASPSMISTQIMSLCMEAFKESPDLSSKLRADIMAVRERDPACTCLPDVFLYFKGFHALQIYRVANYLWKNGRRVLAHYLQSQMSQTYQIDIHPNATLGSGIMLDHGTGIVIGETAVVGDNCSLLHHVTLGGSGAKNVDRHPKVGNGVLIGAAVSVLGNVRIGDGCQIGAGTLVISDLPDYSVAVGVPAKIIGQFKADGEATPASNMYQLGTDESNTFITFHSESI